MKLRNSLLLFLTATIWGFAFVAQRVGMDYVGPLTFLFARSLIGGIVLLPVVAVLHRSGPGHAGRNACRPVQGAQNTAARRYLLRHCTLCV